MGHWWDSCSLLASTLAPQKTDKTLHILLLGLDLLPIGEFILVVFHSESHRFISFFSVSLRSITFCSFPYNIVIKQLVTIILGRILLSFLVSYWGRFYI